MVVDWHPAVAGVKEASRSYCAPSRLPWMGRSLMTVIDPLPPAAASFCDPPELESLELEPEPGPVGSLVAPPQPAAIDKTERQKKRSKDRIGAPRRNGWGNESPTISRNWATTCGSSAEGARP
jgi:hypothetical protein